jgi:hypothetical protein
MPSATVAVTTNNQVITVGDRSFLIVSPDAAPSVRNISLTDGLAIGQVLMIKVSAPLSSNGIILTGNNYRGSPLRGTDDNDMISLIWDGAKWLETSFSNNQNN